MKLGTDMPDGERRTPIDNEVCRTKVKVTNSKNRTKIVYFLEGSCELLPSLGVRRRRQLFQKSSPLKVLDQWKPNLV